MWFFYIRKGQEKNTVFYDAFASRAQQKIGKIAQKHFIILTSFFPALNPQKRENNSRVKDFGGSAAGARPREAKAMAYKVL